MPSLTASPSTIQQINRLNSQAISNALVQGWEIAGRAHGASVPYALFFTIVGLAIVGGLLLLGWTPFVFAAAGAFMLVGPAILAGFFGIAAAVEQGNTPKLGDVLAGFGRAAPALWVLAMVCALVFMIFMTDAAVLYAYMVGAEPVWLSGLLPPQEGVWRFLVWSGVSGAIVALLLYAFSAFSVPLLCERRAGLVQAVSVSVRIVMMNFPLAIFWAFLLSTATIASVLLLPLLPVTLPWLAFASRALYRHLLPVA